MTKNPVSKPDLVGAYLRAAEREKREIDGKNPAAVALGRLGGLKGGRARAKKLSEARRQEIGRMGAKARWPKPPDKS